MPKIGPTFPSPEKIPSGAEKRGGSTRGWRETVKKVPSTGKLPIFRGSPSAKAARALSRRVTVEPSHARSSFFTKIKRIFMRGHQITPTRRVLVQSSCVIYDGDKLIDQGFQRKEKEDKELWGSDWRNH